MLLGKNKKQVGRQAHPTKLVVFNGGQKRKNLRVETIQSGTSCNERDQSIKFNVKEFPAKGGNGGKEKLRKLPIIVGARVRRCKFPKKNPWTGVQFPKKK